MSKNSAWALIIAGLLIVFFGSFIAQNTEIDMRQNPSGYLTRFGLLLLGVIMIGVGMWLWVYNYAFS